MEPPDSPAPTPDDFLRSAVQHSMEGVYFTDLDRRILYWNEAAERISGFPAEDVMGGRCFDNVLMHVDGEGKQLCHTQCPLAGTMADGRQREATVYLHHKEGHRKAVRVRTIPVRSPTGQIVGGVEVFTEENDQFDRRRLQELYDQTLIDQLTATANRRQALIHLGSRLAELGRHGWPFAVLFVDVDRFKKINDQHGHEIGDRALVMVAKSLGQGLRDTDLVARWGGEEFLLILPAISPEAVPVLAERLRALVAASGLRLDDGKTIRLTVSIGATGARPEESAEALVARADRLMYASKQAGRNRVTCDFDVE